MANWCATNKFGIAIWNYNPASGEEHRLQLLIGEPVHICEESEDWYYGYRLVCNQEKLGIFPKSFTITQEYRTGIKAPKSSEIICSYSFDQEVIFTLREWGKQMKAMYIDCDSYTFYTAKELIIDVILCYQRCKSGKLTADEEKKGKVEICEKLDIGNKLLGLDLIIRNQSLEIMNPFETSIIDYFYLHHLNDQKAQKSLQSYKRVSQQNEAPLDRSSKRNSLFRMSSISFGSQSSSELVSGGSASATSVTSNSNCSICVSLINFICTIRQDMEICMQIYDSKENKFISENFVVKWDKQGLVQNIDKLNDIRVVFPDLSKKDLSGKLFLVCQVIRVGTMKVETPKVVQYRKSLHPNAKKDAKSQDELRRPCGIAVYELSDFFTKAADFDENREIFFPFIPYCEKDSLDSLIRKATKDSKDQKDSPKTQGFHITIRDLSNSKMHLLEHTSYVARRIGFPEVILPDDFRNDIYLTFVCGEFHKGSKKSERNIEVTVKVINKEGRLIPDALSVGTENLQSSYQTVVYYHEDRPKWMETIKISLSIDDFSSSHLKFTFKHRSSNENKDKNEKPFAMAFIPLMNENGTTLKDNEYELFVYKVDGKKYNDNDTSYIDLPSSKFELEKKYQIECSSQNDVKQFFSKTFPNNAYTCSLKDSFAISIVVCSTKLAQDINILGLLNWKEKKDSLEDILLNIKNLDSGDVVKFLHDVLDALFDIWMDESTPSSNDEIVFSALVTIIGLLLQTKYMHFQDILNDYIDRNFSATLIYSKLVECFKRKIEMADYATVTCMEYIFKLIVRSRNLYLLFTSMHGEQVKEDFEESLESLLELICNLMRSPEKQLIKVKSGILKYLPRSVTDIVLVYDARKLSSLVVQLLQNIPSDELSWQKLNCMSDLANTELFLRQECRRELLPVIDATLRTSLLTLYEENAGKDDKMLKCMHIISNILNFIHRQEVRFVRWDISEMTLTLLSPMIDAFVALQCRSSDFSVHLLWAMIISLLNQMADHHYSEYFKYLRLTDELIPFLMKLLRMFQNCTKLIFPVDWSDMNLVQNSVMLKTMNHIANFIKERSDIQKSQFDFKLWKEIFSTAIAFITQRSLQLEHFSKLKRKRIVSLNRDMRLEMAVLIRSLWYFLGDNKNSFIPFIIGPLLQVALLPVLSIRQNTIVIFFEMLYVCHDYTIIRNEVITHLDSLVIAGKGDLAFKQLFESAILSKSENHPPKFKADCSKFVEEVSQQIEKLLVYREVLADDDSYESLMSCIVDLLDFYQRIDRREMYIRYLYKLYDLHVKHENYNEAAYTLAKHSNLVEWSDKSLDDWLLSDKWRMCQTHRELKQALFSEIIRNFDQGQLWEAGIEYCKELYEQYENIFFDYPQLSKLLLQMSTYYENIIKNVRLEPEYFHVTYYGKGFPVLLRNKSFIYRGKGYERLVDFTKRLQGQFPKAKLLNKLDEPDEQVTNSNGQYLAIFHVDPVMKESDKRKFSHKLVDEKIVNYYNFNGINEFTFSRPKIKGQKGVSNEFASMWIERSHFYTAFSLPGILCRAEVQQKHAYELNPLQNAIEAMERLKEKTRCIILRYLNDTDNSHPLPFLMMHINGIINADVQGGLPKYEEAFFNTTNANYGKEDIENLKELMASQIPLLDLAIRVADHKQPKESGQASMDGLYRHIVESFEKMRNDFEHKYGKRELPVDMRKIAESRLQEPQAHWQRLSTSSTLRLSDTRNSMESTSGTQTLTKRPKLNKINGSTTTLVTSTLRLRKNRRMNSDSSNSVYASNVNISQSQWYADTQSSMSNLNYIPDSLVDRSLESFPERSSNSRPNSGHYTSHHRASIQSHLSAYHYNPSISSVSIVPMSESCESEVPPPLPAKKSFSEISSPLTTKAELCKQNAVEDNNNDIYQSGKWQ